VRENLWWALFCLRRIGKGRRLWIDGLCIHQADVEERNRQVMQTGNIYRCESKVMIWLGPEHEDVEDYASDRETFALLKEIHDGP